MAQDDGKTSYVTVRVPAGKEYAIITINRPPVNSLNLPAWAQLGDALTYCESHRPDSGLRKLTQSDLRSAVRIENPSGAPIRALIIESGLPRPVFTAGNDLLELYAPGTTMERYIEFNTAQNVFLGRLLGTPLLTVSAIRGACPAAGCAISMCCDYRIMTTGTASGDKIGLNEVALGIPVPFSWIKLFNYIVGQRTIAERMLLGGEQIPSTKAKEIGLLHEIVDVSALKTQEEIGAAVQAVAVKYVDSVLALPDFGRVLTKLSMRGEMSKTWIERVPMESVEGWRMLTGPAATKGLNRAMAALGGRKAKI